MKYLPLNPEIFIKEQGAIYQADEKQFNRHFCQQ